jgi:molybdate transport system substrate-binding protein
LSARSQGPAPPRTFAPFLPGALLAAAAGFGGCPGSPPPGASDLQVYAAASLREAITEAAAGCEARAGGPALFNFGGSNDLARQIVAARKADLFVSADEEMMDLVERAGLVAVGTRVTFLSNRLVVIAPREETIAIRGAADLAAPVLTRLSLADPDAVPAGKYAKAWLARSGVWEAVKDRVVPGVDVRAALAAVESGGVQAGVVYATDAALSSRVKVVYEVPDAESPKITYVAAAIAGRPGLDRSRALLACLVEDRASGVFRRYGFLAPGP